MLGKINLLSRGGFLSIDETRDKNEPVIYLLISLLEAKRKKVVPIVLIRHTASTDAAKYVGNSKRIWKKSLNRSRVKMETIGAEG